MICKTIPDCGRPIVARGMCDACYHRWQKHGDPRVFGKTGRPATPPSARFWQKVQKGDGCWEWQGSRNKLGYGITSLRGRAIRAHRVSWEIVNGPIPDGLLVCHRCDNPACVRPDHLFLGTQIDNLRDMRTKGRGNDIVALAREHRKELQQ